MDLVNVQNYRSRIRRVLITQEELQAAIRKAGAEIDRQYEGKPLLLVSILKGAFVFMSDLSRAVSIPCEIGFMQAQRAGMKYSETSPQVIPSNIEAGTRPTVQSLSRWNEKSTALPLNR